MKKIVLIILGIIFLLAALVILPGSLFVVHEGELAILRRFGEPVGQNKYEPGLHFKLPLVDDVTLFEGRVLKWDGDLNQITTKEMKYIWVDSTGRWRIKDPLIFLRRVGSIRNAQNKLDDIVDSVIRDNVSGNYLVDLVRGPSYAPPKDDVFTLEEETAQGAGNKTREQIIRAAFLEARDAVEDYGIELIDLQIRRLNYIEEVRKHVYQRMISDREQVAAQYKSEGQGEQARILGEMQRELLRIKSEATKTSLEIRGKADAKAAEIFAQAYNSDPEFYSFYRTLESLEKSLTKGNGNLVISTESDFFKYLKSYDRQ